MYEVELVVYHQDFNKARRFGMIEVLSKINPFLVD
jgi:hypothetical protein